MSNYKVTVGTNNGERVHSPFAPSSWPAWVNCPGFTNDGAPSAAALNGTQLHEVFAKELQNPTHDEECSASWAADIVIGMLPDNAELHVEELLTGRISTYTMQHESSGLAGNATVDYFGYADAWWLDVDTVVVADYKSGATPEGEPPWAQLEAYALAAFENRDGWENMRVKLVLLYGSDRRVLVKEMTAKDVVDDARYIVGRRIFHDDHEREACKQCRWCKHRASCHASNMAIAEVENCQPISSLPDAVLLERLTVIEGIIKTEKERIKKAAVDNGGFVESGSIRYEIKESAGTRASVDIPALLADVQAKGIMATPDEMIARCDMKKSDFTALFKERAKEVGVKVKDLSDIYEGRITRNPPVQKLVRV